MKRFIKRTLAAIFIRQMQQIIKKNNPIIVAVVGSVGKTSTKLAIATVLSEKYRVLYQEGNYNTPISVPFIFFNRPLPALTNPFAWFSAWLYARKIARQEFPYDVVVVEIGTDTPGEIAEFKTILQPDIAVLTAISPEHMEFFNTLDAVAAEEFAVTAYAKKLVLGVDDIADNYIAMYASNLSIPVLSYGFTDSATCSITNDTGNLALTIGGETMHARTELIAKHSLRSVAAAALVAHELGLTTGQISAGVQNIKPFAGRMQLLKGIKNSTIIDDSYNASPLAVTAALETLQSIKAPQHIALLGNMNELGQTSEVSHTEIGALCHPQNLDLVVTLGKDANTYTAAIAEQNGCKVLRAESPYQAGKFIADNLQEGAYILIKGSQNGVFSEEAIKVLLADPADASKLVRQSEFWLAKKRKQFLDART